MKRIIIKWKWHLLTIIALILACAIIAPIIPTKVVVIYIDTQNGRIRNETTYFGIYKISKVYDTGFTEWVKQYNLETKPRWVKGIYNEFNLANSFLLCRLIRTGHLVGTYKRIKDYTSFSPLDDPTTVVLEMRRLARIDNGQPATEFANKLLLDSVKNDSSPTTR